MSWTETATRPDGRTYRARKRPDAQPYGDCGPNYGVVVRRTHDVDVATILAWAAWSRYFMNGDPLPPARPGWTRLVPWRDGDADGDWTWQNCTGREPGSVPCVWFHGEDVTP